MSIETRFMFTTGIEKPMVVPKGTLAAAQAHVQEVQETLGLVVDKYQDNPAHWRSTTPTADVSDETLCSLASKHNQWIDWLWTRLGDWYEKPPTGDTEILTPEDAATFWHGTRAIHVPLARWDYHYYRERMEEMYEIMRGRDARGFHWHNKPLTPKQAAGVLWLLAEHLGIDPHDQRMEAPRSWEWDSDAKRMKLVQLDEVQPSGSYDGDGYEWCERCGAVAQYGGETGCPRPRSKCPIKRDRLD